MVPDRSVLDAPTAQPISPPTLQGLDPAYVHLVDPIDAKSFDVLVRVDAIAASS